MWRAGLGRPVCELPCTFCRTWGAAPLEVLGWARRRPETDTCIAVFVPEMMSGSHETEQTQKEILGTPIFKEYVEKRKLKETCEWFQPEMQGRTKE